MNWGVTAKHRLELHIYNCKNRYVGVHVSARRCRGAHSILVFRKNNCLQKRSVGQSTKYDCPPQLSRLVTALSARSSSFFLAWVDAALIRISLFIGAALILEGRTI